MREAMSDWVDVETAICLLHEHVGTLWRVPNAVWGYIYEPSHWKALVEARCPERDAFWDFLLVLERLGVVEFHPTDCTVRWNPNYVPPGLRNPNDQ